METEKVPMALWTGGEQTKEPVRLQPVRLPDTGEPFARLAVRSWTSPGHLLARAGPRSVAPCPVNDRLAQPQRSRFFEPLPLTRVSPASTATDMAANGIQYSERYYDDVYEYRHVVLPPEITKKVPKGRLMSETEWRSLGVQQSRGWVHYAIHRPEPHILLYRRPKGYGQPAGTVPMQQ